MVDDVCLVRYSKTEPGAIKIAAFDIDWTLTKPKSGRKFVTGMYTSLRNAVVCHTVTDHPYQFLDRPYLELTFAVILAPAILCLND